jgi:hypothetical protein
MPIPMYEVSAQVAFKITLHFAIIVFNLTFYYVKLISNLVDPWKLLYISFIIHYQLLV